MTDDDLAFYRRSEERERRAASAARSETMRAVYSRMADHYREQIGRLQHTLQQHGDQP